MNERRQTTAWARLFSDNAKVGSEFLIGLGKQGRDLQRENDSLKEQLRNLGDEESSASAHLNRISVALQKRSSLNPLSDRLARSWNALRKI
jgi:hypothetical protein